MNVLMVEGGMAMVSHDVVCRPTQRANVGASRMTHLAIDMFPLGPTDVAGMPNDVLMNNCVC